MLLHRDLFVVSVLFQIKCTSFSRALTKQLITLIFEKLDIVLHIHHVMTFYRPND